MADRERMLVCAALGLAGESGEAVDHVKKWYEQKRPLMREKLEAELGDVLYYVQLMAMALDVTLDTVIQGNRDKLAARFPEGFTEEAAARRADEA